MLIWFSETMDQQSQEYKKMDLKRGVDYIGVCCVFYCHDGKGKLLMHKRSEKCRDEKGRWDAGSGSMEFGETFDDAVRREIREEYCADVIDLHHAGVSSVVRERNGMKTHWIAVVFAAKVAPEQVRLGDPEYMDEIGWFAPSELPSPLHSKFFDHLELVKKVVDFS